MMKRIIIIFLFCIAGFKGLSQFNFPSTDSLHRYTNRFITNSAINAFTDYRMNTLLNGIINWIDTARLGTSGSVGVDTIYILNDSTVRYRKNSINYTFNLRGNHWTLQQVLNHSSTLTSNNTITIADSLKFTSGKIIITDSLKLSGLPSSSDSTNKPLAKDANGNVIAMTAWPGGISASDTTNKWVNDIRRSNDSVYAFKNGTWQFKYIDSFRATNKTVGLVVLDKFQRASLGSNYQSTVTDLNVALTGSKMTFKRATNGGFANYITDTIHHLNWQKNRIDLKFTIDSAGNGIGFKLTSITGTNNNFQSRFNASSGTATIDFLSDGNLLKAGTYTLSYSIGDTILFSIFRYASNFYLTATNLVTGKQINEIYIYPLSIGSYTYSIPNNFQVGIMSFGGNQSIYDYRVTSLNKKGIKTVFLGNSISAGYGSTNGISARYPARVYGDIYDQYEVAGGGFEKSVDMLLDLPSISIMQPEACFIEVGLNDGGNGVGSSVFQANVDSIVHYLQNNGIRVILSTVLPSVVSNSTEANYNTALNTIASNRSCTIIDVYNSSLNNGSGGLSATYDGGDGIHINDLGHWYLASLIKPYIVIDTTAKDALYAKQLDTLPIYNYAITEPGSNKIGFLPKSNLNFQEISNNGNSTTNQILIQPSAYAITNSQLRIGEYELQSFGTNNIWMGDNLYYGGSGFKYRQTGFGNLIQFNDGQMMGINFVSHTAGTTAGGSDLKVTLKTDASGNACIGGNISGSSGSYSGGVLYIDNGGEVRIGNSFTDAGTFSFQNTGGLYQNGTFRLQPIVRPPGAFKILARSMTSDSLVYGVDSATFSTPASTASQIHDSLTANNISYGTYTPTLTNSSNIDASTAYQCQWMRVGNVVTVSGKVDIDPTSIATLTILGISLPVASAIANDYEAGGTGATHSVSGYSAAIFGDATNDRVLFDFTTATDVTNRSWYFSFTYKVTPP